MEKCDVLCCVIAKVRRDGRRFVRTVYDMWKVRVPFGPVGVWVLLRVESAHVVRCCVYTLRIVGLRACVLVCIRVGGKRVACVLCNIKEKCSLSGL